MSTVGIIWLQDDSGIVGEVGAFISVRASAGVWNRTLLYDYLTNPPIGVNPNTTALTNLSANLRTTPAFANLGAIYGITGLLTVPHQNYPVAFPEVSPTPATELDSTNNSCVDFNYQAGAVPQGAWLVNGVWWTVMQLPRAFQGDSLNHVRVYKSTDYVNWTGVDTGNEPTTDNAFSAAWYFDGVSVISFCYQDGSGNITLKEFTISGATGSYGAVHGVLANGDKPYSMVYSGTTATWHVLFASGASPVYGYSDGTNWTFPAIVIPQLAWQTIASYMLLDPNGTTVHIVAGRQYSQVQSGGVLGPTFNLSTLGVAMTFGGRGTINSGTLFFPTTDNTTGRLYCIVSSGPLSNPTFAAELVDDAFHSDGGVAEESVSLVVAAPLTLACPLSTGHLKVSVAYNGSMTATGGTPPYTFAIIAGALPPGLSLNTSTGVISGTPTTPGTYDYTVRVTDSSIGQVNTADATCELIVDPSVAPTQGGRGFVKVIVNSFDTCLGRDYLLYKLINRELLKCGVKPACFCIAERDWGGNFSEHEEVPMGPPEGAIAFNPTGSIPTPTIASGDNVIFSTRVPIGYDGVILGQYHGYIAQSFAAPPPLFIEGSGDIVWRLESAGRCMRDCGLMAVSIGSLQNMSPIAGGLQIRSGDLIQYIVAAPNPSGNLVPGIGSIVAGIHGWTWPRH